MPLDSELMVGAGETDTSFEPSASHCGIAFQGLLYLEQVQKRQEFSYVWLIQTIHDKVIIAGAFESHGLHLIWSFAVQPCLLS
ncbi:MAG: hypothetical protein DMG49_26895 [Acidobacteria bacterium]|nr:MAG: hypothetical protein DMG49_26895 [Acidobacteriota bacterium]